MKILVAEDDPVSRRLLEVSLQRWGHEPQLAADGDTAWAALQRPDRPLLAVLDFMMPVMNGLEVAAQCRLRFPGLKILMLTGSPVLKEINEAQYPCLRKPLENLNELDLAIEQLLSSKEEKATEGDAR